MTSSKSERDYSESGLTIQEALLQKYEGVRSARDPSRETPWVKWAGRQVHASDRVAVPQTCRIALDLLSVRPNGRHGVDLKAYGGRLILADGTAIGTLRTWSDTKFEDHLEYPVHSRDGYLGTWNVYELPTKAGPVVEFWTGNAGMWIERDGTSSTYHCSAGLSEAPDFEDLIYRVSILPST